MNPSGNGRRSAVPGLGHRVAEALLELSYRVQRLVAAIRRRS